MPAFAQTILQGVLAMFAFFSSGLTTWPSTAAVTESWDEAWGQHLAVRRLESRCHIGTVIDAMVVARDELKDTCESECSGRTYRTYDYDCSPEGDSCKCTAKCKCGVNYAVLIAVACTNVTWVILQLIVGCCVWGAVREAGRPKPFPKITEDNDFSSGVFGCFADVNTCCSGLFCPVVMASKIAYGASIMSYCCALTAYGILFLFPGWSLLFWLARFFFRMSFRQHAGLKQDCCNDFWCTLCCGPCTNCQEARHMNRAIEVFKSSGEGGARDVVVGTPVVVAQAELDSSPLAENVAQANVPEREEVQQSV